MNETISSHRAELRASEIFNEAVLDRLPVGVVVVDRHGYVVKYNTFEENLARRRRQDVIGRSFFEDVAVCTDTTDFRSVFERHIATNSLNADVEFEFALPFLPRPREVKLRLQSFELDDELFAIFLVEDVSLQKELEREKKRLLSILLHDLRNPLSGILGNTQLLEKGFMGALQDDQLTAVQRVIEASRRMNQLIEGTVKEIEGRERESGAVNLHALVLSVLGNLLPMARQKGLEVFYNEPVQKIAFPRYAVVVRGFIDQLDSIVQNLLSNALKYASTTVTLRLETRDGNVVFEVADDGPGIAEKHLQLIFEERFQAPGSRPGEGLGLYSVKRAVAAHDGKIEVESEPGAGTTFRILLPSPETGVDDGGSGAAGRLDSPGSGEVGSRDDSPA